MNISKINITIKNFPDDNNLDKKLVKYKFDNNKKSCIIEVKEKGFWTWIDRFFNRYFLSHNSYDLKKFSDIILKVQPINEGIEKNLSAITTFVISKLNSETEDENTNYSLKNFATKSPRH